MMNVTSRSLDRRTGSEGPKYDPYGYTERVLEINGTTLTLHLGLGSWMMLDNCTIAEHDDDAVIRLWEMLTHMTLDEFDYYYWRAHPYFPDPMGNPRDYE